MEMAVALARRSQTAAVLVILPYDRSELKVALPDANIVRVLQYKSAPPLTDPDWSVRDALVEPIGCPAFQKIAVGRRSACILICDVTRPAPNALMLTPILESLQAAGLAREDVTILIATGLHRPNLGEELVELVGGEIAATYRVENHYGERIEDHDYLGDSPHGVPIWIDRRYVQADLKIVVGLIEPHFMAGYSGGRKLICPGVAALPTIRAWHSPRFLEHPAATTGVLRGNPVHEENTWIAQRAGCHFGLNAVIDDQKSPLGFFAGEMVAALEAGAAFVREVVCDAVEEPVDVVVTSGAGYPLDTTFYQAVKGMSAAAAVVKPGGRIIVAAGMREGVGSASFRGLFDEHDDLAAFMERIADPEYFVMDQWQLEKLAQVRRKAEVHVVTDGVPADVLRRMFVQPAESVEAAVADALRDYGPDASIAVIPKGPYVQAEVAGAAS